MSDAGQYSPSGPENNRRAASAAVLRIETAELNHLLKINPGALIVVNAGTGQVLEGNQQAETLLQISRKEITGKTVLIQTLFKDQDDYKKLKGELAHAGSITDRRCEIRAENNTFKFVLLSAAPVQVDTVDCFMLTFADISSTTVAEREVLIRELERQTAALQQAQSIAGVGSWEWFAATNITVRSPQMYAIYGFDPAQGPVSCADVNRLYTPKSWTDLCANFDKAYKTGEPYEVECEIIRVDGSPGWVISRGTPIKDDTGTIVGLRGTVQDITERKLLEDRNRLIVNAVPDLLFLLDNSGIFIDYHASDPNRLAHKPEDFLGKSFREVLPGDLSERVTESLKKISAGSHMERFEFSMPVAGIPLHFEGTLTPLDRERFMVVVRDITERKKAELVMRENEQNLALAQRIAGLGSWQWHIKEDRLIWSPEVYRIFGRDPQVFTPSVGVFMNLLLPEERARVTAALEAALAGGPALNIEHRILKPNGEELIVHEQGEIIFDENGKPDLMSGTVQDITQRRKADEKVREQATLLDKARDAILVRDLSNSIIYWNQGAERMYGWTKKEANEKSIRTLLYPNPEEFDAAMIEVLNKGEFTGELEQTTKDGHKLSVQARWTLLRDEAGVPKSILCINTDVTERRKLEQQFMRAQRLESIGTLAGGIAHDLNNVLTPIMLAVDVLKADALSQDQLDLVAMIEGSAKRGSNMVRQVLSFARGVEGNQETVNIQDLLSELAKIVQETFPKNVMLHTEVAENLWNIKADFTQLHQVLMNLAVNARDAMPEGGRLSIVAENCVIDNQYAGMHIDARPGNYVVIRCEDTGSGMPAAVLEKIFEPFFTTKELGKGTGLGLSTSIAIIKSHGGFMRAYSEPGRGSRFHLYIPALGTGIEVTSETAQPELLRGNGELVLVVDDEPHVREVTRQTLETFGYKTKIATDGADALAVFAENKEKIALMVTDMMMPVLDGPGVIRVILKIKPDLPIIAVSGVDAQAKIDNLQSGRKIHVLQKPYTAQMLLQAVRDELIKKASDKI